jgi:hypothetical protein
VCPLRVRGSISTPRAPGSVADRRWCLQQDSASGTGRATAPATPTQLAQDWTKSWGKFRPLIRVPSQNTGPRRAIWANPVKLTIWLPLVAEAAPTRDGVLVRRPEALVVAVRVAGVAALHHVLAPARAIQDREPDPGEPLFSNLDF